MHGINTFYVSDKCFSVGNECSEICVQNSHIHTHTQTHTQLAMSDFHAEVISR